MRTALLVIISLVFQAQYEKPVPFSFTWFAGYMLAFLQDWFEIAARLKALK